MSEVGYENQAIFSTVKTGSLTVRNTGTSLPSLGAGLYVLSYPAGDDLFLTLTANLTNPTYGNGFSLYGGTSRNTTPNCPSLRLELNDGAMLKVISSTDNQTLEYIFLG
jgi:hypothetical protein